MYPNLDAEVARAGMSYKKLGEKVGIEYKSMLNKKNGITDFTLKEILRIHKIFPNVKIEILFEEDGE